MMVLASPDGLVISCEKKCRFLFRSSWNHISTQRSGKMHERLAIHPLRSVKNTWNQQISWRIFPTNCHVQSVCQYQHGNLRIFSGPPLQQQSPSRDSWPYWRILNNHCPFISLNEPLLGAYFLGVGGIRGVPLISHDSAIHCTPTHSLLETNGDVLHRIFLASGKGEHRPVWCEKTWQHALVGDALLGHGFLYPGEQRCEMFLRIFFGIDPE